LRIRLVTEHVTAHQRHRLTMLGQFGRDLDTRRASADDHHRCTGMDFRHRRAKWLGVLQLGDGVGEFGGARHRQRGTRAADGVDEVVVADGVTRAEGHRAGRRVDEVSRVDKQAYVAGQHVGEVRHGVVGPSDELVQPDPLDEVRPRVDESDGDVGVQPQVVGGEHACVSATDDDDVGLLGHGNSFEVVI
jgi:hypothetical protein